MWENNFPGQKQHGEGFSERRRKITATQDQNLNRKRAAKRTEGENRLAKRLSFYLNMAGNWDSLGKKKSMKSCDDLTSKYVSFRRSGGALWEELRLKQKKKAAGVIFLARTETLA